MNVEPIHVKATRARNSLLQRDCGTRE